MRNRQWTYYARHPRLRDRLFPPGLRGWFGVVSATYSLPLPVTRLGYRARRCGRSVFPALPVGEPLNPCGQVNLFGLCLASFWSCSPDRCVSVGSSCVPQVYPWPHGSNWGKTGHTRTDWEQASSESLMRLTESTMTNLAKRTHRAKWTWAQRWAKRTNRDRSGVTPTPPHPMTRMPRADPRPHGPRAQSPSRAHTAHSRARPRVSPGQGAHGAAEAASGGGGTRQARR